MWVHNDNTGIRERLETARSAMSSSCERTASSGDSVRNSVPGNCAIAACDISGSTIRHLQSFGSPQDFVTSGILRGFPGFLKSEIFGVGHGHAPRFQQEVTHVLIAPAAVDQHTDVTVDRFYDSEAN